MGQHDTDELERAALAALPSLEEADDHAALVHVWNALGVGVANSRGRWADNVLASEQALEHSRLAGQQRTGLFFLQLALVLGADSGGRGARAARPAPARTPDAYSLTNRAVLLGMLDRFDEAVSLALEANTRLRDVDGRRFGEARLADIAEYRGEYEQAAEHRREAYEWLEEQGLLGYVATFAPQLGRDLCILGRFDEAERLATARARSGPNRGRDSAGSLAAGVGTRPTPTAESTRRRKRSHARPCRS